MSLHRFRVTKVDGYQRQTSQSALTPTKDPFLSYAKESICSLPIMSCQPTCFTSCVRLSSCLIECEV